MKSNTTSASVSTDFSKLKIGSHIHLIGICGTAMGSLAGILKSMGYKISGSDQNVYPPMSTQLQSLGIRLQEGYRAENLHPRPDLVIVGNVVSKGNPEAQALIELGIPYTSLPKAMGDFAIGQRQSFVVAGTHGKTTTTSMLSWVAETCGKNPGFLIGGVPENFTHSFRAPTAQMFIIEGDEYDTAYFDKVPKFVHYRPLHVILTSIEFDHADIYADLNAVKSAFKRLIELIPEHGTLVAHAGDPNILELLPFAKCKVITYGLDQGDYQAFERANLVNRNHFSVKIHGQKGPDVALKSFGAHNTLNGLAVFALAHHLGWPLTQVLQGLSNFLGVKRRQQVLGEPGGVLVIEDFAHHPTAVKMTLESMRERFPGRRLIAVFEPRSATSRRKVFQKDYVEAFLVADHSFIAQAFDQSKIGEEERFSTDQLVQDLRAQSGSAQVGVDADDLVNKIKTMAQKGDVILIMSNGGFGGIYQKLMRVLESPSPAPSIGQ